MTIDADGAWTYTLDNNSAATQALTQGEHAFDVFTYTMHDAARRDRVGDADDRRHRHQ